MYKKIVLLVSFIICMNFLNSCGGGGRLNILINDEKRADVRMDQIANAIKSKDKKALKSLLSVKALKKVNDIDESIDQLFDLIDEDVISWERFVLASSQSSDNGKMSKMLRFDFTLSTENKEYSFFIIDYNIDTMDSKNEGVYMIELIIYTEEQDLDSWQDRMRPGIYIH